VGRSWVAPGRVEHVRGSSNSYIVIYSMLAPGRVEHVRGSVYSV
jgi:hypothetical protein